MRGDLLVNCTMCWDLSVSTPAHMHMKQKRTSTEQYLVMAGDLLGKDAFLDVVQESLAVMARSYSGTNFELGLQLDFQPLRLHGPTLFDMTKACSLRFEGLGVD